MGKKVRKVGGTSADRANKHDLYERAVQDPAAEMEFIERVYRASAGRSPRVLREDFCGTAFLCWEWARSRADRVAHGLDLHAPTLDYGVRKHRARVGAAAARVHLHQQDVASPSATKVEVIVALNFSYCVFLERAALLRYFRSARAALRRRGVFILDIHGGPDAQIEVSEETNRRSFTYVWEQRPMDAISALATRFIHFRFPDGSSLERAFRYDWRVWTLPEMRELLAEAGFAKVEVYWEGATSRGTGNGVFRKVARAENESSWIAYVVGVA